MMKLLFALLLFLMQDSPINISSPQAGEMLIGQVEIIGNMDTPNFASAELAFSYAASNSANNWFAIQTFSQPVADPTFAVWDTASLTDGDYTLRLRVFLQDGTFQDLLISDLKIRNDTPLPTEVVPTETAFPQFITTLQPSVLAEPPATSGITYPSPTPLPSNPASVTISSIYSTFGRGALIVLVLFAFFSLILRLRKN